MTQRKGLSITLRQIVAFLIAFLVIASLASLVFTSAEGLENFGANVTGDLME